jgi:predicted transcriptional regulator
MENQQLVELTAEIVAAHVSNNPVALGEVGNLVSQVHAALSALGNEVEAAVEKVPVVSVRASIKPDHLVCMECGAKQKMLKRHLQTSHGMSPDQYRKDYGLPSSYPMVAAEYADRRRDLAKQIGLGRKKGEKPAPRRGRKPKAAAAPSA